MEKRDEDILKKLAALFMPKHDYNAIISQGKLWSDPDFTHDNSSIAIPDKSFNCASSDEIFHCKEG